MARVRTEGLELGTGSQIGLTGNASVQSSVVRTGLYALFLQSNAATATLSLPAAAEYYIRFHWRYTALVAARIMRWQSGLTELGSIRQDSTYVDVYVGTTKVADGAIALNPDTWYMIELHIKIADAGGVGEVRIEGIVDATFSGDTKPGADTTLDVFEWVRDVNSGNTYVDDIAANDVNGASDTGYPGDGRVLAQMPDLTGDDTQWDGSDGDQTNNYALVDERPHNSDTDYVYSNSVGARDLYMVTNSIPANAVISRVWGEARGRTTVAGDYLAMVVKTYNTEFTSPDVLLPTSYGAVMGTYWAVNPYTNSPWVVAEVNSLQIGPKAR